MGSQLQLRVNNLSTIDRMNINSGSPWKFDVVRGLVTKITIGVAKSIQEYLDLSFIKGRGPTYYAHNFTHHAMLHCSKSPPTMLVYASVYTVCFATTV